MVLDLLRPDYLAPAEYFQYVYMGVGRARKLDWILLRNFPTSADGELDWSIFEKGPPDFLCDFMEALEDRARKTLPKLLRAQGELQFPAFEAVPKCAPDPDFPGRFLYNPLDWGFPVRAAGQELVRPSGSDHIGPAPSRKRLRGAGAGG